MTLPSTSTMITVATQPSPEPSVSGEAWPTARSGSIVAAAVVGVLVGADATSVPDGDNVSLSETVGPRVVVAADGAEDGSESVTARVGTPVAGAGVGTGVGGGLVGAFTVVLFVGGVGDGVSARVGGIGDGETVGATMQP